jgi:hypothetical protein
LKVKDLEILLCDGLESLNLVDNFRKDEIPMSIFKNDFS